MITNEHVLQHAADGGNGYHGRCIHCQLALVTDLGYDSWSDTKCIDREIVYYGDIPKNIMSYASFNGYRWNDKTKMFTRASFSHKKDEMTLDQMNVRYVCAWVNS